jgi:outer membrane immunogenic protein
MNRLAGAGIALFSLLGMAGSASAADLPVKAPVAVPVVYNWTGLYLGAHAGYGWGDVSSHSTVFGAVTSHNASGGFAGGQVGYNWQIGIWVLGVEADASWADLNGSAPCPNPLARCASETNTLASVRARVGWATGAFLLYGTGGLGYASTEYSALRIANGLPDPGSAGVYTADRWGYTLGAGVEYGLTQNWSVKLEYLHYGFDTEVAPTGTISVTPTATTLRVDTVKLGVNYRF